MLFAKNVSDNFTAPAGGAFVGATFTVWKVSSCMDFSKVLDTSITSSFQNYSHHLWSKAYKSLLVDDLAGMGRVGSFFALPYSLATVLSGDFCLFCWFTTPTIETKIGSTRVLLEPSSSCLLDLSDFKYFFILYEGVANFCSYSMVRMLQLGVFWFKNAGGHCLYPCRNFHKRNVCQMLTLHGHKALVSVLLMPYCVIYVVCSKYENKDQYHNKSTKSSTSESFRKLSAQHMRKKKRRFDVTLSRQEVRGDT